MNEKVALVTGANRGIGREIARQLAALDWIVLAAGRDPETIRQVASALGPKVVPVVCDITRLDHCAQTAALMEARYGRLDVLVNNAGIIGNRSAEDFDLDQLRTVLETNFFGTVQITRASWDLLLKSPDARVINLSSGMGSLADQTHGDHSAYRLSKWMINGWTRQLSADAGRRITVQAMCPGWVRTDMGGPGATRPVEQGAETAVWLATAPGLPSGRFWRDKAEIPW